MKLNCWEIMDCGREPGGRNAEPLGVCPVSTESRLDGVHGGTNAGRACWIVARAYAEQEDHGPNARDVEACLNCRFFQLVCEEEEHKLTRAIVLMDRLRMKVAEGEAPAIPGCPRDGGATRR